MQVRGGVQVAAVEGAGLIGTAQHHLKAIEEQVPKTRPVTTGTYTRIIYSNLIVQNTVMFLSIQLQKH